MSNIYAQNNLKTNTWDINLQNLDSNYVDLHIGFSDQFSTIQFTNLQFGYELKQEDNIKQYEIYPSPGGKYIRTDQPYLITKRINFSPDNTYTLYLWCENNSIRSETNFEFTTPKPLQPFSSWTWDGIKWNSPLPYPEDDQRYLWDEETHQSDNTKGWVLIETS